MSKDAYELAVQWETHPHRGYEVEFVDPCVPQLCATDRELIDVFKRVKKETR